MKRLEDKKGLRPYSKLELPNISPPKNNQHYGKPRSRLSSQDSIIWNMFEDASLNGTMPSTPNNEYGNITLPSLPGPNIDTAPTNQEDKVKNLLELTRLLMELNASIHLMAKEIHEGTYSPCWVTKIF